ncbi:hypothetical protein [Pararhodobacter zhoushanensis]|uniref:hypothetical protein n=1 Tax=Pararhodobacter zhoushanensis TaxID=2479545 RepID=UPI000F8DF40B|nr:hypothetical protein [Pararhodobacter zhoushanensis]
MPTLSSAPFTATSTFSETADDFALGDIALENATGVLSGTGTRDTLVVPPLPSGTVSAQVTAGSFTDAAGNASLASDAVRITNRTVAETQGQITRFMLHRAEQLVSNQPGLICLMQGTCAGGC